MDDLSQKSGSSRAATRAQILSTFNRLLLAGEKKRPAVSEIVTEAGVARSTFYDHFDGVEALFDESLSGLFRRIAHCLVGAGEREEMVWLMAHILENRERGRKLLSGPDAERIGNVLSRLLHEELGMRPDARLHAILISGTVMAALGAWMTGKLATTPETLSDRLLYTSRAILGADDDWRS
ncbi:TetR/AcrR family transcriptional regulator [Altererythrobacter arenosus]|uniref:TetR/AcrR family transcriptional regulator n=1 Tax=Altererythrobacter arenosus TaxID=3032592 RepID=A0ABY8FPK7_9SPHN|nr:TetR/AcrR family transcriptional regulator [Altererythrobacter sp. CAU 1644]WFL76947.1 TetR/AcrR family transcriptional regulator [Altererythrobacter sp. CAU 1644]